MATIPLPALAVRPPDPIEQYGRVLSLQNLMKQQQLIPLQIQQAQQQTEQGALDLQSQKAMMEGFRQFPGDPDKALNWAEQNGALPKHILAAQTGLADYREKLANTNKTVNENNLNLHNQAQSVLQNVLDHKPEDANDQSAVDPQMASQAWAQIQQRGLLPDIQLPQGFDPTHVTYGQLRDFTNGLVTRTTLLDQALKQQQAQEAAAKIPGEQAESAIKSKEAEAIKNLTPQSLSDWIDSAVPARGPYANLNSRTHALAGGALAMGDIKGAQEAVRQAAESISQIERETNPQVIGARIAAGVGTEIGKLKAQQKMFPSPIVGVAPHLAGAAVSDAQKAGADYVQAQSAAQEMQSFIDLARQGNVEAYAYEPTTGVLTINTANGTKRINTAEIQQYGGAGSLLQRIQGWAGKQISGKSIPDSVLNDMEQLHQQLANNTADQYRHRLEVINGTYGSTFQPIPLSANAAPRAANANNPQAGVTVTDPRGGVHTFPDQKSADAFKKAANIQ
jgi:hypothetical protein